MRVPCRLLYRSIKAASGAGEAHVGPLASRHTVPNRPGNRRDRASSRIIGYHGTYPDISGHIRTYPDISGHVMIVACERSRCRIACPMVGRVRKEPVPDRVPDGRSRAKGAGAGSRTRWSVACGIARRRIACRMARRRIASRCVPARVGDLDVPAVFPVGRAEGPSSAMSRPNSACSRRRHRRLTNVYSFTWPWRSITVQSAARLRRALGGTSTETPMPNTIVAIYKWVTPNPLPPSFL